MSTYQPPVATPEKMLQWRIDELEAELAQERQRREPLEVVYRVRYRLSPKHDWLLWTSENNEADALLSAQDCKGRYPDFEVYAIQELWFSITPPTPTKEEAHHSLYNQLICPACKWRTTRKAEKPFGTCNACGTDMAQA